MRYEVAILLIICGTLLVLAPPASDYFTMRQSTEILRERGEIANFRFQVRPMDKTYRMGCWFLGAGMIFTGIAGSMHAGRAAMPDEPM